MQREMPKGWVPPEKRTTAEREQCRAQAREWTARNYTRHLEKQGKRANYEEVKSMINERADKIDKQSER